MPCECEKVNIIMHAIIIILLLYIVWQVSSSKELYLGSGVQDQVYTSGADLRDLGQVFSSTDQGRSNSMGTTL